MALTKVSRGLLTTSIVDNGNATAITIDASENVGIGTGSPTTSLDVQGAIQASESGGDFIRMQTDGTNNIFDVNSGAYVFRTSGFTERMRIDSSGEVILNAGFQVGSMRIHANQITSGFDYAGEDGDVWINYTGYNGGTTYFRDFRVGNGKQGQVLMVDGSSGSLLVGTTSAVNSAKMSVNGNATTFVIHPAVDNNFDCGHPSYRWDDIRATNGTIQTSDRNEKQDIEALSEAEQRVAVAAKGLMRKFRWISSVQENGDNARIHFGIIAQDLQDAFTAEGLDAGRYAMFISDTWWETQTEVAAVEAIEATEDTEAIEAVDAYTRTDTYDTAEEAPEGATERTRLGVRYNELLAFIIAAI